MVKSPGRIGTPYVLNYNALQHLKYSCQTDLWSLACTAFRLQQKERVIPPPSDTDAWTYYANAIRSGVKLNNKIRTFQYCLARCKALYPILKLLTTAGCTAETFIRSRELKTIRSRNKFTAKDDISKFERGYFSYLTIDIYVFIHIKYRFFSPPRICQGILLHTLSC